MPLPPRCGCLLRDLTPALRGEGFSASRAALLPENAERFREEVLLCIGSLAALSHHRVKYTNSLLDGHAMGLRYA